MLSGAGGRPGPLDLVVLTSLWWCGLTHVLKLHLGECSLVEIVSDKYGTEIFVVIHARWPIDLQCTHKSIRI